jgi:hypothetical protein
VLRRASRKRSQRISLEAYLRSPLSALGRGVIIVQALILIKMQGGDVLHTVVSRLSELSDLGLA